MEHVRGDASKEIVEGRETPTDVVIKIHSIADELGEMAQSRSGESERWRAESIYRIPWNLRKLQEKAYQPQMVSIGPYHHGNLQLKEMEEHKRRALHTFLERSKKPLVDYKNALAPVMQDLKNAYPQLQAEFKKPGDERFLTLMIVDGCFMLELMQTTGTLKTKATGYADNDPIFSKHGALYFRPLLKRDMLMLENQIPLLVLIKLVEAGVEEKVGEAKDEQSKRISQELGRNIFQFLERGEYGYGQQLENFVHILDIYRKSLFLSEEKPASRGMKDCFGIFKKRTDQEEKETPQGSPSVGENDCNIRSATEIMKEAGIWIVRSATEKLDDISFSPICGIIGFLRLPKITVDDTSEYLYLNLMAFERLHQDAGNNVTSYVFFMDRLIESAADVSLLHRRGVLENALGSDQDVANLFNSLSTDVCLDPDSKLFQVQMGVAHHYRGWLPWIMALACQNYCANPLVTLSVVAAIFLFALTITQTVFAILDYKKK